MASGGQFDAREPFNYLGRPERAPFYIGLFRLARGQPALGGYIRILGLRPWVALGILEPTALPLRVVIT